MVGFRSILYTFGAACTMLFVSAVSVVALPPLKDQAEIRKGLQTVAAAFLISEKCADLSPRKVKGFFYLNNLRNKAKALGYSEEQIDAYVSNEGEKTKLKVEVLDLLVARGLVKSRAESYCTVGRMEVASKTEIGGLLY